jgi:hypothetical protein
MTLQYISFDATRVSRVVGKMHTIDDIDIETEELERENCGLIANVLNDRKELVRRYEGISYSVAARKR